MIERDEDRAHAHRVVGWLTSAVWNKYAAGIKKHSGHLPDKGGLLHEAECEVLDQAVYIQTLREQLERVYESMQEHEFSVAMDALGLILHGTPEDRLPT